MKQPNIFHEPLHPKDSETQTYGCRHTNSDICSKSGLPAVCALVRQDNICTAPSKSWAKQFHKLGMQQDES